MARAVDTRETIVRVGRNAAARLGAQVTARLLSLVLVAVVTRYEGSAGLGRYVLVTTLVGLAAAVTDLGLSVLLTREVARRTSSSHRRELLEHALGLRMASAAIGSGLLVALAQTALFPVPTGRLFHLGAIILLPKAASGIMAGFINGRQRMDVTSSIAVTVRLLTLAGAIPALAGGFSVGGVLVCTAAAEVVGVLGYGLVLRSWHLLPGPRLAPSRWRTILSEAYPFALTGIIAMAYRRLDIVLLSAWRGDAAAGQYGAAYGLWEAVGMVPSSLLDAMFPEMARLARGRKGIRRLRQIGRRTRPWLMIGGLLISGAGTALAGTLMGLVYGPTQGQEVAVTAFRLQVWAIPAMFLYLLNGHALYALGRQRWVTAAMTIVGLLTVGLNLLVIPRWSVLGVSAVALCSAWLLWVLLSVLAGRAFRAEEDAR